MTKKIIVLVALFVLGLGFGFNSAEASKYSPAQIATAISKTDAQNRPLRQIMVFDRDDLYVAYDILVKKNHKGITVNGQPIKSREFLACVPAIESNSDRIFFRIRYQA